MRDHIFISYATEDWPLAEWLARRLTAEGYRVWCDRFKLLGGESYPEDIDKSLEQDTFRVLALLSHASLHKDNPRRERTKALNLAKPLGIPDFLIPLNVDGLGPAELPWMTSDITFIPFDTGWARGLTQLLTKLISIKAPRPLIDGAQIAAATFLPGDVVRKKPESLFTNCLPFTFIPERLFRISLKTPISKQESWTISSTWPHYAISAHDLFSFYSPQANTLDKRRIAEVELITWQKIEMVSGVRTRNVISSLLYKYLRHRAVARGMRPTPEDRILYLPVGLVSGARLQFDLPTGGSTYVQYTGERAYWQLGERRPYRYHLAVSFRVRRDLYPGYVAQLLPTLYFTDLSGTPLSPKTANSRRKHLTRDWWNYEWFNRHLVIASVLSGRMDVIRIVGSDNDAIELSSHFLSFVAPISIDETVFENISLKIRTAQVDQEQDSNDDLDANDSE